jgi:hypothetical protein
MNRGCRVRPKRTKTERRRLFPPHNPALNAPAADTPRDRPEIAERRGDHHSAAGEEKGEDARVVFGRIAKRDQEDRRIAGLADPGMIAQGVVVIVVSVLRGEAGLRSAVDPETNVVEAVASGVNVRKGEAGLHSAVDQETNVAEAVVTGVNVRKGEAVLLLHDRAARGKPGAAAVFGPIAPKGGGRLAGAPEVIVEEVVDFAGIVRKEKDDHRSVDGAISDLTHRDRKGARAEADFQGGENSGGSRLSEDHPEAADQATSSRCQYFLVKRA